ncbi:MAG: hypothetical protein ABIR34_01815 [Marmoricola sp.]
MRKLVVVLVGTLILSGVTAVPAIAKTSLSIRIGPVRSLAHGAAIKVRFTYACAPKYGGSRGYAIVAFDVTQRLRPTATATGTDVGNIENLTCDNRAHSDHHIVASTSKAFRAGRKLRVTGRLLACDAAELHCKDPVIRKTLRLRHTSRSDPANAPLDARAMLKRNGEVVVVLGRGCPAGGFANANLSMYERVRRGRTARAEGIADASECRQQGIKVLLAREPVRIRKGIAYVVGNVFTCEANEQNCQTEVLEGTLKIS